MLARIKPSRLAGTVPAIASKSMAHRLVICAALCAGPTLVRCNTTCDDIEATVSCLEALGARIIRSHDGFSVTPIPGSSASDNVLMPLRNATLDCRESGSTLRFMLPVAGTLGAEAEFVGSHRLAERPIGPLYDELFVGGCNLSPQGRFPLTCAGKLRAGRFQLPGNVSSQFISGLLLAAPLLGRPSEIVVSGRIESKPYIDLTINAMRIFGVEVGCERFAARGGNPERTVYTVTGDPYTSPGEVTVEGDWSNAAFWLCAAAMGDDTIQVTGLDPNSPQGDRAVLGSLLRFGAHARRGSSAAAVQPGKLRAYGFSAANTPDLVPILACVAAVAEGTTHITDCGRLRMKESDRLVTTSKALNALGAKVRIDEDSLIITGTQRLAGGRVYAHNDHRIAMMAAIAATRCEGPVEIVGAECVAKSYPQFFDDYHALGGSVVLEDTERNA